MNDKKNAINMKDFLGKYTMVIALVVVFFLFVYLTGGRLLYPQNMSNLLLQNAYVLLWPAACFSAS